MQHLYQITLVVDTEIRSINNVVARDFPSANEYATTLVSDYLDQNKDAEIVAIHRTMIDVELYL